MEDRKPTVLIVARDADTANDVATLDRSVDCIAWFAGNDETIPQAMVRLRPDVIMLDLSLPDMTAPQFFDRLRASGHTTPVLALSEGGSGGSRRHGIVLE